MGSRETDPRLQAIWDSGGKTYSISKLNTINQCQFQAFLNYVQHEPQSNGIYGIMGTKSHDSIEDYVVSFGENNHIKEAVLEELSDAEMCGISFPKSRDGSDTIRNNWIANMTKFAESFTYPNDPKATKNELCKFETEFLILLPIPGKENTWLMGYVDAIRHNEDGTITLIDWKTSSQFDKEHLLSAGRQLIVYKLALEKLGYKVRDCCWCMLKYCETEYTGILKSGKDSKPKTKISEWRNLAKDLKTPVEKMMMALDYDDIESEHHLNVMLELNSLESLPAEIKNRFKTSVYFRPYEITDELIEECWNYINNSIHLYETLGDNADNWKPCDCSKESYFCSNLCGYGVKKCKYFQSFCDSFVKEETDEYADLF